MLIIGLTGGIATGKSTAANILKGLGCHIIDADEIAKRVVQPHKSAWEDIVRTFGQSILLQDGSLNRQKLGEIIFADEDKRKLLNKITHPRIIRCMLTEIVVSVVKGEKILVLDLPLLFEKNYHRSWLLSKTIVVYCEKEQQLERLIKRNNLTTQQATERINSQMDIEKKCKIADIIIDNSKDFVFMEEQLLHHFNLLNNSRIIVRNRCLLLTLIVCIIALMCLLLSKIWSTFL